MGATLMAIRAVLGLDDSEYSKGLQNAERQGKKTAEELRKDVMKMAAEYRKGGMDASEAIKKAWAEIDRTQYETAEKSEGHAKKVENNWSESAENAGKSWGGFLGLFSRNLGEAEERSSVFAQVLKANIVTKGVEACISGLNSLGNKAKEVFNGVIDSYSNYEQLAGGIETLFKGATDTVMENAANAFQTAGMSANQYMELVTSFSASLIQSTGRVAQTDLTELKKNLDAQYDATKRYWEERIRLTKDSNQKASLKYQMQDELKALKARNKEALAEAEKANQASNTTSASLSRAAALADLAITDMADNVNKMGSTLDSVQNAYRGFSKGTFTMLDNLGLGYQGSTEEMQRLLNDAERLTGKKFDIESYADIVEAVHAIQENMGISGATKDEAGSTLEGSKNALKAAWDNLITAMGEGNERKLDKLWEDVVESGKTAFRNFAPVAEKALFGILHLFEAFVSELAQELPDILYRVLPRAIQALGVFVGGIAKYLPKLAGAIIEQLPKLADNITTGIRKTLIPKLAKTISDFVGGGDKFTKMLTSNFRKDFRDIVGIFRAVGEKLAEVWTGVIQPIAQGVVRLITGTIMPNLFNLYRFHIAPLWEEISPKISATIQKISRLWTKTLYPTIQKVSRYILKDVAPKVVDFLSKQVLPAVSKVVNFVKQNLPIILSVVSGVIAGIMAYKIGQTITNTISIVQKVVGAAKALWAVLAANPIAVLIGAVVALVSYLVYLYNTNDDVRDKINAAWEAIKGYWENTLKPVFENLWKYVTETVVPAVVSAWNDTFLPALESAWGAIKGFWENTLKPVFVALYDYVWRDLIPTLIVAWEYQLQPAIEGVFSAIAGFWENTLKPALTALYDYVWRDLIPTLIVAWEYYLAPAIKGVFEGIGEWWEEYGQKALQAFYDFVDTKVVPIIQTLGTKFGNVKRIYLVPVFNWVKDSLTRVWGGLQESMNGLVTFLTGVFAGNWEQAWQGLVNMVTAPFNALKDVLKTPINAVIGLINSMIEAVENALNWIVDGVNNNLRLKVPDWIPVVGGKEWNPGLQSIKWGRVAELAKGGTVREGGLAVVGEKEPEWLQVINGRAVVTPMTGGSSRTIAQTPAPRTPINERPINIVFELEGAQKWIYRLNKAEEQRVGLKLSTGGSY